MRPIITALLTVLALCAVTLPTASAQEPPPPPEQEHRTREERERFQDRLRLMRMIALTEALELDEATAAKLFPYLREGDEAQGVVQEQIREHRQALKAMAEQEVFEDKAIDEHIRAIGKAEQAMSGLRSEQVEGLKRILTPEQRLKFLLTRAHLERELREALREHSRGERRERRDERGRGERGRDGRDDD